MAKRIMIFILVWVLVFSLMLPAFASVGIKVNEKDQGAATDIDFSGVYEGGLVGSTFRFYSTGCKSGSTISASQASNLGPAALAYGLIQFEAGTSKTITIAAGVRQQMLTLSGYNGGPAKFITIHPDSYPQEPVAHTGWSRIQIGGNDRVTLLWLDDTTGWIIVSNFGTNGGTGATITK